jgi:small basic protein (TIGR04137 family)
MSQHPSLRSKQKGKRHRSVLKRYERVRELKEKEKWKEGDSIFGLLKLKILKFKLKKEKAAPAAEGAAAAEGAPVAEGAASAAAEGAQAQTPAGAKAPGKEAAPKADTKKKEEKKK